MDTARHQEDTCEAAAGPPAAMSLDAATDSRPWTTGTPQRATPAASSPGPEPSLTGIIAGSDPDPLLGLASLAWFGEGSAPEADALLLQEEPQSEEAGQNGLVGRGPTPAPAPPPAETGTPALALANQDEPQWACAMQQEQQPQQPQQRQPADVAAAVPAPAPTAELTAVGRALGLATSSSGNATAASDVHGGAPSDSRCDELLQELLGGRLPAAALVPSRPAPRGASAGPGARKHTVCVNLGGMPRGGASEPRSSDNGGAAIGATQRLKPPQLASAAAAAVAALCRGVTGRLEDAEHSAAAAAAADAADGGAGTSAASAAEDAAWVLRLEGLDLSGHVLDTNLMRRLLLDLGAGAGPSCLKRLALAGCGLNNGEG